MMAITHHLMVRYAAYKENIKEIRYALLGDDLLLVGSDLFRGYRSVIESAKMILNDTKTFRSKDLFEFAKRFYYKGEEITPFPIGAVLTSESSIPSLAVSIDNAFAKSWLRKVRYDEAARRRFLNSLICDLGSNQP